MLDQKDSTTTGANSLLNCGQPAELRTACCTARRVYGRDGSRLCENALFHYDWHDSRDMILRDLRGIKWGASLKARIANRPRSFLNAWKTGFARTTRFGRSMSLSTSLSLPSAGSGGSLPN